jgi:hypothetical protein
MRWMGLLTVFAIVIGSCSEKPEYSEQQRSCISQRHPDYDARNLGQCVDVCRSCMNGNVVTCNTSCKLKGAN